MLWTKCFRAKKVVAMTGNYAPPEVTIRSYPDSPICDVVVVVRGQEMVLRGRDYRQAMRWARLERKTYKILEPDTGFPANHDLPLFLRSDRNDRPSPESIHHLRGIDEGSRSKRRADVQSSRKDMALGKVGVEEG